MARKMPAPDAGGVDVADPPGEPPAVPGGQLQAAEHVSVQERVGTVHHRSLALYAKLGFSVQESLACMQGPAVSMPVPGYAVRSAP
jgi:hypothetical protein